MVKGISTSVRIFLGIFIILLAVIGIIGNTTVVTVLKVKNIFTRKTTSLILTSLAVVDLLGSTVDIPLAFSTMVASPPDRQLQLYHLSLAQVALGPLLFLGYITCFFLLSFDRNDALRKTSNRQVLLTTKRIMVVLALAVTCGVAISLLYVFKSENPNPLLPRKTEPRLLTVIRAVLFLAFVIAVSSNVYFYLRIKKLIKNHTEHVAANFSEEQISQWHVKERKISWTVIQVIMVVCFSYVPFTITSIIYDKADTTDIHLRNAMAICRSLTYLKYAVNAFIFTRLDGKFLRVFFDILRGTDSSRRKIIVKSFDRRVTKSNEEENPDAEVGGIDKQPRALPDVNEVLNERANSLDSRQGNPKFARVAVREMNHIENDVPCTKTELLLPTISVTSPQGKTIVLLKEKRHRTWRKKCSVRRSRRKKHSGQQSEAAV
ncbi:uncharacterized protein LOC144657871 [Oculina patagonica]